MGGSGIRSVVGAVVGLCSRLEAGNLHQRAFGAMGLGDCTVLTWGFYTDPVSPSPLFDFFTGNLANSYIHLPMNDDAHIHHCPHAKMLRNYKERIIVP